MAFPFDPRQANPRRAITTIGRRGFIGERDADGTHTTAQECHILSGSVGWAKRAGHPGPVHQNRTILKLLVLGNLADDIGPERPCGVYVLCPRHNHTYRCGMGQ
jgi:hypothetical protein